MTSWDDGSRYDVRLSNLLLKYKIPAVFFIPSNCELNQYQILQLRSKGFEIGGHTATHPQDMKLLDDDMQLWEIKTNKEWLEEILNEPVTRFCYPRGKYNDITVEKVKEAGYTYARTTVQGNTRPIIDPFRVKTSVHVYPENAHKKKPDWFSKSLTLLERAEEGDVFHLWGHSWEIERFNLWDELESFFKVYAVIYS